uniref:Transmembrane protein 81 n=1 Tax=Cyclopterus lumpus TaxID=8103 RepID=A0A8C2ZNP0_CYCLU
MQHETVRFNFLLLLFMLLHRLTSVDLEEVESMPLEVIVDSSPCSATCGLGIKTQTLCLLKDGERVCHVRKVKCLESWQCGLRTMTVTSGQRVEIDCLGEVMENSHFNSTYCCVVQDVTLRRVKRAYWGIRVLPVGFLNLDYESSLAQWDCTGNQQNETVSDQHSHKTSKKVMGSLGIRLQRGGKFPRELWLWNFGNFEKKKCAYVFLQKHITGNLNVVENKTMHA